MDFTTNISTSLHILSFSIVRLIAVKRPFVANSINKKRVGVYIIALWIFSFLLASPLIWFIDVEWLRQYDPVGNEWPSCSIRVKLDLSCCVDQYNIYMAVLGPSVFYIPEILVLIFSLIITRVILRRRKWMRSFANIYNITDHLQRVGAAGSRDTSGRSNTSETKPKGSWKRRSWTAVVEKLSLKRGHENPSFDKNKVKNKSANVKKSTVEKLYSDKLGNERGENFPSSNIDTASTSNVTTDVKSHDVDVHAVSQKIDDTLNDEDLNGSHKTASTHNESTHQKSIQMEKSHVIGGGVEREKNSGTFKSVSSSPVEEKSDQVECKYFHHVQIFVYDEEKADSESHCKKRANQNMKIKNVNDKIIADESRKSINKRNSVNQHELEESVLRINHKELAQTSNRINNELPTSGSSSHSNSQQPSQEKQTNQVFKQTYDEVKHSETSADVQEHENKFSYIFGKQRELQTLVITQFDKNNKTKGHSESDCRVEKMNYLSEYNEIRYGIADIAMKDERSVTYSNIGKGEYMNNSSVNRNNSLRSKNKNSDKKIEIVSTNLGYSSSPDMSKIKSMSFKKLHSFTRQSASISVDEGDGLMIVTEVANNAEGSKSRRNSFYPQTALHFNTIYEDEKQEQIGSKQTTTVPHSTQNSTVSQILQKPTAYHRKESAASLNQRTASFYKRQRRDTAASERSDIGQSSRRRESTASMALERQIRQEKSTFKQLVLVNISYILGYVPITTYFLWISSVASDGVTDYWFGVVAYFCLRLSESVNPIIYNLTSSNIGNATRKLLRSSFKRRETA